MKILADPIPPPEDVLRAQLAVRDLSLRDRQRRENGQAARRALARGDVAAARAAGERERAQEAAFWARRSGDAH